jgi:nitrogenase iron protein NifH
VKVAVYGKGGIGKSTIASNLSATLAGAGKKVLQVGCDPKHDSTRLLLGGKKIITVLDYLRDASPDRQCLEDVLHVGYKGVACAEAGGPEPGVGCAGRGILSTFELLERLGVEEKQFDVVVYDVLGDVVCGGFAVPLRKGYADVIYIVTSEEYMSIYAANNILRGVKNFDDQGPRLAGLILNSRGSKDEDKESVYRFAEAVKLPIKAVIPRSDLFRRAEEQEKTLVEAFPKSKEAEIFSSLARDLLSRGPLFPALPIDEEQIGSTAIKSGRAMVADHPSGAEGDAVRGGESKHTDGPYRTARPFLFLSKSVLLREPLHGCAFAGAVSTTTQIRGTVTVAHGPRSCTHIVSQTIFSCGRRSFLTNGIPVPELLIPALFSSDLNESTLIHGGTDRLVAEIKKALDKKPQAVFVVTTCPSGVIGENIEQAIRQASASGFSIPIIPIASDGNMAGDYTQGVINACIQGAASFIDVLCRPEDNRVNIVAEKNIAANTEPNFRCIRTLLKDLGLAVNCRFVRRATIGDLKGFLKGRLNLLAYADQYGRVLRDFLRERFGATFAGKPFPVGFHETGQWLKEIAEFFGREERATRMIDRFRRQYREKIGRLRPLLAGKRLMVITYIHDIDWIIETALDLEMEVEKVCILSYSQDHIFRTRYPDRFEVETGYPPEKRDEDLRRLKPHILLCNYSPARLPIHAHVDAIPLCPDVGFYGGLRFAERWAGLLKSPEIPGWSQDHELFE